MRVGLLWAPLLVALLSAGCTERQLYDSATGWRQSECNKILDQTARAKCLETATRAHDRYRKAQ